MRLVDCRTIEDYNEHSKDPLFGTIDAIDILENMKVDIKGLTRKTEGSCLLFHVGDIWLKLSPPFFGDSFRAELKLLKHFEGRLDFQIPRLLLHGKYNDWDYMTMTHVPGTAFKDIKDGLSETEKNLLVEDLSVLMRQIFSVKPVEIPREFGSWAQLAHRKMNDDKFHQKNGVSEYWISQINSFLREVKPALVKLYDIRVLHADLNHEHILFEKKKDQWRLSGVIDFADGMLAPKEIELVLPFLTFLRWDHARQRKLWNESGFDSMAYGLPVSHLLMGLTLCNRFLQFEKTFQQEIKNEGLQDIRAIADRVFFKD